MSSLSLQSPASPLTKSEFASQSARAIESWIAGDGVLLRPVSTMRSYRRAIDAWIAFLVRSIPVEDGEEVLDLLWLAAPGHARSWQAEMKRAGTMPATNNQVLACVSSFYTFALENNLAPASFVENPFRSKIRREPIDPYKNARTLSNVEYRQLISWLEEHSNSFLRLRAHAMIRTFLHTGWRGYELLSMRAGDLRPARSVAGALEFHCRPSEGREFVDLLPADCVEVVRAYLERVGRPLQEMRPEEYIWPAVRKGLNGRGINRHITYAEPISVQAALGVMRSHLRKAGIADAERYCLPDLRHTHAMLLYESGADFTTIRKRMRFSHKESAERFLRAILGPDPTVDVSAYFLALRTQPGMTMSKPSNN